jgi:hypothetical protein
MTLPRDPSEEEATALTLASQQDLIDSLQRRLEGAAKRTIGLEAQVVHLEREKARLDAANSAPERPLLPDAARSTQSKWTAGAWEVWPPDPGSPPNTPYKVVANRRQILAARSPFDAHLAAAAPRLYQAVLGLLQCFEEKDGATLYRTNEGVAVTIPREFRGVLAAARRTVIEARENGRRGLVGIAAHGGHK